MQRRPSHPAKKVVVAVAALALSLGVASCGSSDNADLANGKTLFVEKCGGCHKLANAGTAGTSGPDLDDAFRRARIDGMGNTVQGIVEEQIKLPSQNLYPESLNMPANLVTGIDARDVAAYVAHAAGDPKGKDTGALADVGAANDGAGLFKTNCGSCHTLADAGTSGTSGPNLDGTKLKLAAAIKQITNGGGGMPAFGGTLTDEQIKMIAEYVEKVK